MATAAELKKKTQSFKMGGASGFVPGIGSGDKVPAKYEPGEFVVSRDMLALDPKLGAHLSSLREMALAKQGMTPKQADAKAMMGGKLHAARGFGDFELVPIDPAKEIPQTKMAKAMQNATRINSRLPPPAWAPATPQPAPAIQAPNFTASPGAAPTISGPPAPPKPISAPNLGFSEGAHRDNRINFNTAPEPTPVNATTSMGAAPGRSVVPVDAGRGFTPPYGASFDPKTIYRPTNTSPGRALATIGEESRALVSSGPGRFVTPNNATPGRGPALTADAGRATQGIKIPSGYTPPKVNPATGAYANQGPASPLPIPEPTAAQRALGSGAQWRDALNPGETGRLVQGNPGTIGKLAGKAAGAVGAIAKPLAIPLTAYQLGSAVNDGRTGDAAWAAGDLAASGALFTPAAPAAGAYLGARGLYEGSKMAGNAITSNLSSDTLDTIGGTVNQAVQGFGRLFGKQWGVNDDALLADKAQAAVSAQKAPPTPAPATNPAQPPAKQAGSAAPAPEIDATGKVKVTRQPNGTMEFSGKDITGDPQYTDTTGFKAGGYGVSSLGGPIAPSAASQVALTNPDGSRWSAQDSAVMAANMRDGIDAYRGTSRQPGQSVTELGQTGGFGILDNAYKQRREVGMPLDSITANKSQKSAAAAQLQAIDAQDMQRLREGSDTARAAMGNATTAANNKTVNDMARQRLGFDAQRVGIEGQKAASEQLAQGFGLRSSQRMEDAQKALLDPNATPAARKLAQENLINLSGKAEHGKDNYIVTRGGEEMNPDGMTKRTVPERIFDSRTGQYVDQPQAQAKQSAPPAQAVAMLKANPKMAADFDAKYGAGAAAQIMGQK